MVLEKRLKMGRNPLRMAADKVKDMDAAVQNRMRDLYGLNAEGEIPKWKEATLGAIHPAPESTSREGYVMTRGIQAGGLTAAGYGLMKLTEQFGGAADQQEPGQLSLSDEDQETYNKIKALQAGLLVSGSAALGYGMARGDGNDDLRTRRK